MLDWIHTAALLLSLTGGTLVAIRWPFAGHAVWLPANALWIAWAWAQSDWRTGTLFAAYMVLTCIGMWKWRRGADPCIELKPIPEFPGYFADTFGDVHSTRRGRLTRLKSHEASDGYLKVTVRDGSGTPVHKMVCRLVCSAFHGRPRGKLVACHRNGKRTDNQPSNLCWGTQTQNERDKVRHGTNPLGARNGRAKITAEDVRRIRHPQALPAQHFAQKLGISVDHVRRIRRGENWKGA